MLAQAGAESHCGDTSYKGTGASGLRVEGSRWPEQCRVLPAGGLCSPVLHVQLALPSKVAGSGVAAATQPVSLPQAPSRVCHCCWFALRSVPTPPPSMPECWGEGMAMDRVLSLLEPRFRLIPGSDRPDRLGGLASTVNCLNLDCLHCPSFSLSGFRCHQYY